MECYIIKPAQSLLMKHLVIGQRYKAPDFSAFHWSGFHWSAFRNHQGSTLTEKDRNKLNYRIGPLWSDSVIELVSDLITESDQAVRAVHSCNSWLSESSNSELLWRRIQSVDGQIKQMVFCTRSSTRRFL